MIAVYHNNADDDPRDDDQISMIDVNIYVYLRICICLCACIYIYIYVYIHICMCMLGNLAHEVGGKGLNLYSKIQHIVA